MRWAIGTLITLSACTAEREFSGIWQQVCNDDHPCEAGGLRYELHLGRYGGAVTGLLVRYRDPGGDLDPFRKSNDCGCFFVDSGRAESEGVRFRLDDSEPGFPDEANTRDETCVPPPPECSDRRITLVLSEDDALEGTLGCGSTEAPVRFEPVSGRPRTTCLGVAD